MPTRIPGPFPPGSPVAGARQKYQGFFTYCSINIQAKDPPSCNLENPVFSIPDFENAKYIGSIG
ncbi:MAG: hypothetical protein WCP36_04090 [Methanomicrobiales archaeon]